MKTKIKLFHGQVFCAAVVGMTSPLSFAATFSDANWISMGGIPGTDGTPGPSARQTRTINKAARDSTVAEDLWRQDR